MRVRSKMQSDGDIGIAAHLRFLVFFLFSTTTPPPFFLAESVVSQHPGSKQAQVTAHKYLLHARCCKY